MKNLPKIRKNNSHRFPAKINDMATKEDRFPNYLQPEVGDLSSVGPPMQGLILNIDA